MKVNLQYILRVKNSQRMFNEGQSRSSKIIWNLETRLLYKPENKNGRKVDLQTKSYSNILEQEKD